jgi:uncharacterized membrane protein
MPFRPGPGGPGPQPGPFVEHGLRHHNEGLAIAGLIVFSVLAAAIIVGAFFLIRAFIRGRDAKIASLTGTRRSPALDELDILYARGQVSREEYLTRRADLLGTTAGYTAPSPPAPPAAPPGSPAPSTT